MYVQMQKLIAKKQLISSLLLAAMLSACATQTIEPVNTTAESIHPVTRPPTLTQKQVLPTPDLSKIKAGKTLNLVRTMEGGACKNDQYGVIGLFKLYAALDDINRIKTTRGPEIFTDYSLRIQDFAMHALQQAIKRLNFKDAINAQNNKLTQTHLMTELTAIFIRLVADDIAKFKTQTTLTIDVVPDSESLIFYLDGCVIPHAK